MYMQLTHCSYNTMPEYCTTYQVGNDHITTSNSPYNQLDIMEPHGFTTAVSLEEFGHSTFMAMETQGGQQCKAFVCVCGGCVGMGVYWGYRVVCDLVTGD